MSNKCSVNINSDSQEFFKRAVPPLAGVLLILLFVRLGFWQLDRAQQKIDMQQAFDQPASHVQVSGKLEPVAFQSIRSQGRYLADKQVLIDNAILGGQLGYYVISALEYSAAEPLLLVNRGWIRKGVNQTGLPDVELDDIAMSIQGKAGHLPRVAIRPGEAFANHSLWPRIAVWPTADDIAAELGRDVLPYVLLLDPDQNQGYLRRWQPPQSGPSTHYGYAFQWFAMAITVFVIVAWNRRKLARQRGN